jgi:hypothetical protein
MAPKLYRKKDNVLYLKHLKRKKVPLVPTWMFILLIFLGTLALPLIFYGKLL